MNTPTRFWIISGIWLLAGVALLAWSIIELSQVYTNSYLGTHSGAFQATLIGTVFALLCILGAVCLMKRSNWGRILLLIASCLMLLYATIYFLMEGKDDTSTGYALTVIGFAFLSISSILVLRKSGKIT